jgi:hypothetical protein
MCVEKHGESQKGYDDDECEWMLVLGCSRQ